MVTCIILDSLPLVYWCLKMTLRLDSSSGNTHFLLLYVSRMNLLFHVKSFMLVKTNIVTKVQFLENMGFVYCNVCCTFIR